MNILMVVSNYLPVMCGYSTRLHGIVFQLAELGHNVTILAPKRSGEMEDVESVSSNITVIRYPYHGFLSTFTIIKKIHELIKEGDYDLVSGHSPTKNVLATCIANFFHHKPMVFTIHYSTQSMDLPKWSIRRILWKYIDDFIIKRVDKNVVISSGIKKDIIERGISNEKIIMLPNGVNINIFSPRGKNTEIQKKYDLEDRKVILFLGKFQEWERLDKLVEVFAQVRERQDDIKLLLVGDGPEREKVEKEIEKYNLANDVTITGFVPFDEVPKYYSVCDVFVMVRGNDPHMEMTTPLKPIEAMAMGKVVISTDVGGMREIIEDGKTGFLVPHSIDAIADKIIEVLNDPHLQEKIGANARKYVKENRDWKVIINNLVNAYEEAIKKH